FRKAIPQDMDRRVNLPLFSLMRDRPEHGEHILERSEVIAPIAQDMNDFYDAPVLEFPKAGAGIRTGDTQRLGDLIRRQRLLGKDEEGVNLRDGPVDAPTGAHFSPVQNELLGDGIEVSHKCQSVLSKQK